MIVIIDNYDSFVHNLARYFREAGTETIVFRNDEITVAQCLALDAAGYVISPGPKAPAQAGMCLALINALPPETPLLGVCLGHQCLIEAFGGKTMRAAYPLHGEASALRHNGHGLFANIPSPTLVGRYHSLIGVPQSGGPLTATAWSADGELMAVNYPGRPWYGVQFHPESLLTDHGRHMIDNFLKH